jgi:hypothetical protein
MRQSSVISLRVSEYTTFGSEGAEVWEEVPPIPPGTGIKTPIPPYIILDI